MRNEPKSLSISVALKRWREKHPSLARKTVLAWIAEGLVECRKEQHGFTKWHMFSAKEIERVYNLLKTDWQQGEEVFPRSSK